MLPEALLDQIQALLADKAYAAMIKTPGSLGTAPGGSSDSTEVQSKATLGVRPRQVPLATPD